MIWILFEERRDRGELKGERERGGCGIDRRMICTGFLSKGGFSSRSCRRHGGVFQKVPLTISRNFALSSPQYRDVVSFDRRRQVVTRYLLDVPKVRTVTMLKRVFAHAGPTLWNTIPEALRSRAMNCTLDTVKKHIKSFLFVPSG